MLWGVKVALSESVLFDMGHSMSYDSHIKDPMNASDLQEWTRLLLVGVRILAVCAKTSNCKFSHVYTQTGAHREPADQD